jgi:hypothetical protein
VGIRPVADFEILNYQIMIDLNTSTEATITDETAIGFIPCYAQFYRYEWQEYAECDHDGDYCAPSFPNPKLELRTYDLIKETEKGYWIGYKNFSSWKKWIPKTSKRRFAYPTKQEAMKNFITRTKRRIKILKWQIDCCNIALGFAERTVF